MGMPGVKLEQVQGTPAIVDNAEIYEKVKPYIRNWRRAVDIGAFHGEWSRMLAVDFDEVVAFEVRPENYEVLKASVPMNVFARNLGLGMCKEEVQFTIRQGYAQRAGRDGVIETYTVKPLDSLYFGRADFVKLDVDGSEWEVIHGGIELFRKWRPVLCIEVKLLEPWARSHLLKFLNYRCIAQVSPIDEVWEWAG